MVWGHHLQLWSHPPLFCNFWHFNVKVVTTHHPIIQKEVDELVSKEVFEPSSGSTGFYSSMFVVPKHTGSLQHILNLKRLIIICLYLLLGCLLSDVWQLIQHGDYAFSIDLQDAYLHIPFVKNHCYFIQFVWHNIPSQWKVWTYGLATASCIFAALSKPILFLCCCKSFCIVIYLDDILVLIGS